MGCNILIGFVVFSCSSCESLRVPAVASSGGRLSDMSCEIICFWAAGNEKKLKRGSGSNFMAQTFLEFVPNLLQILHSFLQVGWQLVDTLRNTSERTLEGDLFCARRCAQSRWQLFSSTNLCSLTTRPPCVPLMLQSSQKCCSCGNDVMGEAMFGSH